ncbi:MAG: hypothetical protein JNL73_14795 [Anaerolineales bacterium]|nr:hypothetical protein [Anaerolineales bacterium]
MSSRAPTPSFDGPFAATEPTVTTALDITEAAPPLPTTTGTPTPTAAENLQVDLAQPEDLPLELVQAAHDFAGLYSEVFNASYMETADLNGNGQTDILVALNHATCTATSGWPCLTAVEWDGSAYVVRAVVAQPLVGVDPGFRPERYEGYLTTSTSDTGAFRVWLSLSGHADLPASGLYALVGGPDSASLAVESYTPLLRAPQALWALADGQGRSGVLAVTWDTAITALTNANTVQWLTDGESNVDLWSKDSTALLYAGTLPGLDGTFLLQEHIFTTRANDLVAYRVEGQDRQPVENPLPVDGSLKGVYRGHSVLGPTDVDSLVLLRTETRCALGNPNLCALDVDPVMGDQAVDYIEIYDRVEGAYGLRARVLADPEQRPVYRLMLGDLDGDGLDEIVTSNGILYEWEHGQALFSRSLEEAGQSQWTYFVETDGTETLHAPLAGRILDVDGDGRMDLAFLVIVVRMVDSMPVETTSLFVATLRPEPSGFPITSEAPR